MEQRLFQGTAATFPWQLEKRRQKNAGTESASAVHVLFQDRRFPVVGNVCSFETKTGSWSGIVRIFIAGCGEVPQAR